MRTIIGITMLALLLSALAPADPAEVIQDVFILSDLDRGWIDVRVWLAQDAVARAWGSTMDIAITDPTTAVKKDIALPFTPSASPAYSSIQVRIDNVMSWHPKTPNLYQLEMTLHDAQGRLLDSVRRHFGIRKIETRGNRFFVNNQPFYIRACGHEVEPFLDTLDRKGIEKRLRQVRRYGFNTIRHHSHIPSQEYLDVADEVGVFIQMEIHGKIGTDPQSARFLQSKKDWARMIRQGRRHACAFIYSMGNEIYKNDAGLIECQNLLYDLAKTMDPSVLVLNRSGSNPFNDAHGKYDLIERPIGEYEHVAEFAREAFLHYLRGDRKGRSEEVPIVAHEYPLVASYPNPALAAQYDEEPEWLRLTVENARKRGLEHLLPEFVWASEEIQALCRKEMLEEARKFRELDGYSMLRFTDCMARVSGVTTDFADPKNVTAEEFLKTNGETALLCTWANRCFIFGDVLEATIEISHHGPEVFSASQCRWWLRRGPEVLAEGAFDKVRVDAVDVAEVGKIMATIPSLDRPAKLTLRVAIPEPRPAITNEWSFWAFPEQQIEPAKQKQIVLWDPGKRLAVYANAYPQIQYIDQDYWTPGTDDLDRLVITDRWQEAFYDFLDQGGRLWIISDKSWPWPEELGIFGLHITKFIPSDQAPVVFPEMDEHCSKWPTICSNSKSRHGNSGTLIYPHPALGDFPHEGFCDLHFWPMIYRAKSLQLDRFPAGTEPIIRTIDNFYRGQSKGYMAELRAGKGIVLVSMLNLTQSFPWSIASRYLFDQMLRYQRGDQRRPSVQLSTAELEKMIEDFAVELESRDPLTHNEMPARYTTRWKWLMSPTELVILPIYDAEGADASRLDVHWEYAQTQWYLSAKPGDRLTWPFDVDSAGDFTGTFNLAGPLAEVVLDVQIDDQEPRQMTFPGSDSWSHFVPVDFSIMNLPAGEHQLSVSLPYATKVKDGRSINIRDVELRAKGE